MAGHSRVVQTAAVAVLVAGVCASTMSVPATATATATGRTMPQSAARHVLLLSVDGMHERDLTRYVRTHPRSALAALTRDGTAYTHARTTFPSDSFPGMVAMVTGGGPGTTGVYYDDTYNRKLFPAGTRDCTTATAGTEVPWTEAADRSQSPLTLDAGQGLTASALRSLPTNSKAQTLAAARALTPAVLAMTPNPQTLLDPATLPVDPATCLPLYPHRYLRVNTVFEVARAAGLRTAWSDKHPAYEILSGRSGTGVQDLFTPEINSVADAAGDDWTADNALTAEYDSFKVAALLNEIDGLDHSGRQRVGTPAVFGMNFQTLSTAQKLPISDGLRGGYRADGTPGPLVSRALDYVNTQVGRLRQRLAKDGLSGTTTIILSAKHGQSPIRPALLRRVDDALIIDGVNRAWAATHPKAKPLVAFAVDDDVMLWWLSDRSATARRFAARYLRRHRAPANTVTDPKGTHSTRVAHSGLASIRTGRAADLMFGAKPGDAHAPDLVGLVQHGVVYTGGVKKIAEHGGNSADDRIVPLVVAGAGSAAGRAVRRPVATTQIAPTILSLLGLRPRALQAVRAEGTPTLP